MKKKNLGSQSKNTETDILIKKPSAKFKQRPIPLKVRYRARWIAIFILFVFFVSASIFIYKLKKKNNDYYNINSGYINKTEPDNRSLVQEIEFLKYLSLVSTEKNINYDKLTSKQKEKLKKYIIKEKKRYKDIPKKELKELINQIIIDFNLKEKADSADSTGYSIEKNIRK